MNRISLFKVIECVVSIVFLLLLLFLLVTDKRINYVYQNGSVLPNVFVVVVCVLLFLCAWLLNKNRNKTVKSISIRTLLLMNLGLFCIQILVSWQIFFKTGWDCEEVTSMANYVAFQNGSIGDNYYFSMYPNNVLLVGIFSGIHKLTALLGIKSDYYSLIVVGCLLVNAAGFFMTDLVRRMTHNRVLIVGIWTVFAVLSGLSPWISIPYSDTYSILFPMFLIWLYRIKTERNKIWIWGIMGFVGVLGFYIKPTVILTLIGICGVEIVVFFTRPRRGEKSISVKTFLCTISFLLGIFTMFLINNMVKNAMNCSIDENKKVTPIHYLMMGLNYSTCGTYDQGDVNYSMSADTVDTRNEQDWEQIKHRMSSMGIKGLVSHLGRKTLTVFNDGSFAWGKEGEFYWNLQERSNFLAECLRTYFYEEGSCYWLFQTINQSIWIVVILMNALNILQPKECIEDENIYTRSAIAISLMAIIVFEILFEARARYLYLYSPLFFAWAILGAEKLKIVFSYISEKQ